MSNSDNTAEITRLNLTIQEKNIEIDNLDLMLAKERSEFEKNFTELEKTY